MAQVSLTFLLLTFVLGVPQPGPDGIHAAALRGDLEKVRALVTGDPALLTLKGPGGMLPIHLAARGGHVDVVTFLLDRGADPNSRSLVDFRPLHLAAMSNRQAVVELLLARGADLEACDRRGMTPLMAAADERGADVVRLLLGRGADAWRQDAAGASAFDRLCAGGMWDIVRAQVTASRQRLTGVAGAAALHAVAAAGNGTLANELLALGADTRTPSATGDTLLVSAAKGGLADLTRTLLEGGHDPRTVDKAGRTALHYAVLAYSPAVVDLLARRGADLAVRGADGRSALDIADDNGFVGLGAQLEQLGAKRAPRTVHRLGPGTSRPQSRVEITYLGNDGFLIESGSTRVIVDGLQRQQSGGMVGVSDALFDRMLGRQGPFESVPLLLFSHAHLDHFNGAMAGSFLRRHSETRMVGNALVVDGLAAQDKDLFEVIRDRVVRAEPEWGRPLTQRVTGVEITTLPVNHATADQPYKTCAFVFQVGGIKMLHLGDNTPEANLEAFKAFGLEQQGIDILFADLNVLGSGPGRTILSDYIKPRATILMHIDPGDVPRLLKELGPTTPGLHGFREPMEKQFFGK